MKSVWNYYYSVTKRMLLLAGQWPYQRRKERLLRVTLMTMTSLSMIIPQIGKFIQCGRDVQCILTTIPLYLFQILFIVKLYACQFNNSKIKDLTDQVYSDWESLEIPEEYEIMKTYAAKARLFSLIYISYYAIAAPLFILIAITPQILDIVLPLNESRSILMPYEAHYFVHDDRRYFYYILFHAFVAVLIVITGVLAHDCMVLTYIEHVCSIFAVAGFRFENLAYNKDTDLINDNLINMYNQKIAISVHAHWQALHVTKRMLLLAGQWPYQRRKERLLRVTLMTMTSLSMIIPQIGKFIQCGRDVQCILTTIPSYLFQIVVIVKLYACQFNNSKIKDLTDQVYSDWESLEIPEEYEIMKTYAAKARLFSLIYTSYYAIAAPLFILLIPITPQILDIVLPLNESRSILMPYEAHYFVHDDREYFYYILFHALVAVLIVITGVLAHDCMVLTYIEHVCSIFAVAGFRFENLAYNKDTDLINDNLINMYNQKIAISVHAHWQALQFAKLLKDTFSITFGIQIAIVTVAMSISLLQMVVQDDTLETMRYMAFIIGQLIHIFCFSLQGQRLIDHSLKVRDKIYNCFWYNIPVKSQRLLLNVMRRSLQPNILTAGGIYIFSLKSFTTVLQSSMSYFTVLASFQ
ncbi:odorant receptor 4-like [Formica exsecta]|uniref:odorant receptor 4-like n=1 Tax=Formica exsecta TaxID=72781 RepID=UPI001144E673|nr:odorant receptor 4-like [Formica exsecta]